MSQSQILHAGLQKKLDGRDELIDTLEREKKKRETQICARLKKLRKSYKWHVRITAGVTPLVCKYHG